MKSLATWPKGKKALKASTVTATPSQCTRGEFRIAMWRKENGTATAAKETEKEERERETHEKLPEPRFGRSDSPHSLRYHSQFPLGFR